jgi:hypothetical protein
MIDPLVVRKFLGGVAERLNGFADRSAEVAVDPQLSVSGTV